MNEIESARNQLRKLDQEILDRVKLRQDVARAIGERKGEMGLPTRDFNQETVVHRRVAEHAREIGLSPDLAVRLTDLMIESSLTAQERDRVRMQGEGDKGTYNLDDLIIFMDKEIEKSLVPELK